MKKAIGFIGSANREMNAQEAKLARELGKLAAEKGLVSYSGACPGYPLEATRGAKEAGGITIGIAPAGSFDEHTEKWNYPTKEFDSIVFTGMGRARNFLIIRASDALVVLGGRVGTLNEVSFAYDEGKVIGVLEGFGGIASKMKELNKWFSVKDTGARVVFASRPGELIKKILELIPEKID